MGTRDEFYSNRRRLRTSRKAIEKEIQKQVVCMTCFTRSTIFRHNSERRREGHSKHVYCFKCKRVTRHKEYTP